MGCISWTYFLAHITSLSTIRAFIIGHATLLWVASRGIFLGQHVLYIPWKYRVPRHEIQSQVPFQYDNFRHLFWKKQNPMAGVEECRKVHLHGLSACQCGSHDRGALHLYGGPSQGIFCDHVHPRLHPIQPCRCNRITTTSQYTYQERPWQTRR